MKKVTFVLTACGRNDLLEKTLDGFFKYNTHPIERYIITEDSADPKVFEECERLNREKYDEKLEFIFNYEKLGQAASIDKAYSMVDTEYIFHCEEDWEFYRSGFIEDSIKVLETQPKVIQAWIRPKSDKILNKIEDKVYTLTGEVKVRRVLPISFIVKGANKDGTDIVVKDYIGFSWNPGVKRLKDWQQLPDGYSGFVREHLVDHYYRDNGFMVVSLSTNDEEGYVRHLGWGRRAGDPAFIKKKTIENIKTYNFYGLRRSGNHAILEWLIQNIGGPENRNIIKHRRIIQCGRAVYINEANTYASHKDIELDVTFCQSAFENTIIAYEDVPTNYYLSNTSNSQKIVILRDIFNLFSSRYKYKNKHPEEIARYMTSMRIDEKAIEVWKEHANSDALIILFEKWIESKEYRDSICKRLGIPNHDITDTMTEFGEGSSFTGQKKPTVEELKSRSKMVNLPQEVIDRLNQPDITEIRKKLKFIN